MSGFVDLDYSFKSRILSQIRSTFGTNKFKDKPACATLSFIRRFDYPRMRVVNRWYSKSFVFTLEGRCFGCAGSAYNWTAGMSLVEYKISLLWIICPSNSTYYYWFADDSWIKYGSMAYDTCCNWEAASYTFTDRCIVRSWFHAKSLFPIFTRGKDLLNIYPIDKSVSS